MISALVITNSESVQLDTVNRKIYKFQALVFEDGYQVQGGASFASRSKETSTQPSKTEYVQHAAKEEELQRNTQPPARKRSKTAELRETKCEAFAQDSSTARKSAHFLHEGATVCSSCHQVLLNKSDVEWSSLMEKSKEELVAMVMNLQEVQQRRERKKGYCPTDDEMVHLVLPFPGDKSSIALRTHTEYVRLQKRDV